MGSHYWESLESPLNVSPIIDDVFSIFMLVYWRVTVQYTFGLQREVLKQVDKKPAILLWKNFPELRLTLKDLQQTDS